ncbi:hypothetical protein ACH5RR_006894, partial [Cinchona calisaya]
YEEIVQEVKLLKCCLYVKSECVVYHFLLQMARPGTRGQVVKRQCQEQQITKNLESLGGSNKISSMSTNSNATKNQTLVSSPMTNDNRGQPQTSESHAYGNNETILIIRERENAFENHEVVPTSGLVSWKKRGPIRNLSVSKESTKQGTLTIEDEFEPVEDENSKIFVHKQMNSQYRNYWYRLHKIFLKYNTKEEAIKHVPDGVSESDWIWLCDNFTSENFQKRKEGVELSEIDLYELSRDSKKNGGLVNDKENETLEKMKELKATTSMTTKDICEKEVG